MAVNPPLLFVGGLFFVALSSMLYSATFLITTAVLYLGRGRLSHAHAKRALMAALLLPPVLAALPTLGGATLRHSHAAPLLEHHSMACYRVFTRLSAALSPGVSGVSVAGSAVNGLAWLLIAAGIFQGLRLVVATIGLERGLSLFLRPPTPRLARAVAHVGQRSKINGEEFHECPMPAAYSSVFGLSRPRCVLSEELVAAATEDELNAIVAHEAMHLRARDVEATFAVSVLDRLFFYLRPVRLLARRWREEAELACDAAAVEVTGNSLAMAAAILRVSGTPASERPNPSLPAVALAFADESASLTEKRVENLIARARRAPRPVVRETRLRSLAGWALTLALGSLGVFLLLSPQAICTAHCSLETVARLLP